MGTAISLPIYDYSVLDCKLILPSRRPHGLTSAPAERARPYNGGRARIWFRRYRLREQRPHMLLHKSVLQVRTRYRECAGASFLRSQRSCVLFSKRGRRRRGPARLCVCSETQAPFTCAGHGGCGGCDARAGLDQADVRAVLCQGRLRRASSPPATPRDGAPRVFVRTC